MAACVVPVQIVKDVMIMGGKTASTTVCDLTANQKVMFGLSTGRKIPVQIPISRSRNNSIYLISMCMHNIYKYYYY